MELITTPRKRTSSEVVGSSTLERSRSFSSSTHSPTSSTHSPSSSQSFTCCTKDGALEQPIDAVGPSGQTPRDDTVTQARSLSEQIPEHVFDAFQDDLERNGVPTEIISRRRIQEMKMIKPPPGSKQFMPSIVRIPALNFMQNLIMGLGLDQSWFECAALLDVTYCLTPGGFGTRLLPATAMAVVKLIFKTNGCTECWPKDERWQPLADRFSALLASMGYEVAKMTKELLAERETAILTALQWQVNLPSVDTWLSMFCIRFNVLTRGLFDSYLAWVSKQSTFFARALVFHEAAGQGLPPHQQAAGVFAFSCVSAQMLPLNLLKPAWVPSSDWESLFLKSQLQKTVPDSKLPQGQSHRVQTLLQEATQMTLEQIQEACYLVARRICIALQPQLAPATGIASMGAVGVTTHRAVAV